MRRAASMLVPLALTALAACSGGKLDHMSISGKKDKKAKNDISDDAQASIAAKAASDEEAIQFLTDTCSACHAKGADLHSTWPMPEPKAMSLDSLQGMDGISVAYQALVNKASKAPTEHRPSAMPPGDLDKEQRAKIEGVIYWFQLNMPSVVKEAEETYGASDKYASTLGVDLNFQCKARSTTRDYAFRLFNQALGRLPTMEELQANVPAGELKKPVTDQRRAALAKLVTEGNLKSEFLAYGIKIFAQRIGGAGSIKPNQAFGLNDAAANDLKEEFYRLVLDEIESAPYKDILLAPKVKVTSNTFKFYDEPDAPCADPGAGAWGDCQLSPRRSNFFGTLGFLRSTPSSFLVSNNNYKRGGEIHAILRGERLMAQTDGPQGEKARPLPSCLTSADERVVASGDGPDATVAPRGSLAVPRQGAVCQGCHLQKWLGVASFAFRSFDENGFVIGPQVFNGAKDNPYNDMIKAATEANVKSGTAESGFAPVNVDFLKALLDEPAQGKAECITDRTGKKTLASIANVGDLTKFMVGDGTVLVHGLARYIPSAISNLPVTNQEIISAMSRGYEKGDGKLLPIFRAYFESETFSCATGKEE